VKSQADANLPVQINREILQQPIERRRRKNCWPRTRPICSTSSSPRRESISGLSRDGRQGKVTFEFPPREGEMESK